MVRHLRAGFPMTVADLGLTDVVECEVARFRAQAD
jgi:hypothetical protein